jgi:lantibiotic biosynthesis dehydratase-like protein
MSPARPALGGGWTLWPHALVRGAGFPFALLDDVYRSDPCALRRVAADARFREAVTWQNRPAIRNALDPLLRREPGTQNAKTRRQQLLVAKYLQRYCAKNDTIGFFGPVGWATIGADGHFAAGPQLVDARAVFFEPWAIRALASTADDAPLRLQGNVRVEGGKAVTPNRVWPLTDKDVRVVRRGSHDSERVEHLVSRGILRREFPVSISLDPDRQWRETAPSPALAALTEKRKAVAHAAGDPVQLDRSLEALESEFESRTGLEARPRRRWGRGLVYEECRRDISMDLGRTAIDRIAPALRVVMQIARWYTFEVATHVAAALLREHRRRIPLHVFWRDTAEISERVPAADGLRRQWRTLWSRAEQRGPHQHLDPDAAQKRVARQFAAPCPGWPGARHHAPDLMWDAPGPEAVLAGQGTPVLSGLHPGITPFTTLSVLSLCPVVGELEREWQRDFPAPLISPIPWEEFARSTHDARLAKRHWHLDVGEHYVSDRDPAYVLRAADFDVVQDAGRLVAVQRRGALQFDLLRIFERRMKLLAAAAFSLSDGSDVEPRRYLGPLVVQRAQWRVKTLPDSRIDAWRMELGMPQRVFVRVPREMKPIYVDFASPVSVEMLRRFARGATSISISEMLPGPGGLWLRDRQGNSYTSELRMMAVDPKAFSGRRVWQAAAELP